ncbi:MAG: glycosyltransferase family 2 protein [Clostridiales bacterium]|nr:glycosyltransferase family 2 protein [Candidatus Coliplasma equi]
MDIKEIFSICNYVLTAVFVLCYIYQFFYIFNVFLGKDRSLPVKSQKQNKFGVVICARNEENVIGNLLDSINRQDYPSELVKIFLVADNCTDNTAQVGRDHGATVIERFNNELVGKGYALDMLFKKLLDEKDDCDAYIIFDADNLVDKNFIKEMNVNFNRGYAALTSYRNSKNYGTNWISAGYSLWFLREAKYLNNARMRLGTSCAISGTGFCVSRDIIARNGGWPYHLLTEDIEFSADLIVKGEKIGYSGNSIVYDEQPETFKQSWKQRMRWAKGFYQVFGKYGGKLFGGIFRGSFACYDMFMTICPAIVFTVLSVLCCTAECIYGITIIAKFPTMANVFVFLLMPILYYIVIVYMLLFIVGFITVITEWDSISCTPGERIKYLFTFPLFMLTYAPIGIAAIFKRKVAWDPIKHSVETSIEDIEGKK